MLLTAATAAITSVSQIEAKPLYPAAGMHNFPAKHEELYRTVDDEEFNLRMIQVTNFIRKYLLKETSGRDHTHPANTVLSVAGHEDDR